MSTDTCERSSSTSSPVSQTGSPVAAVYSSNRESQRPLLPRPQLLTAISTESTKIIDSSARRLRNNVSLACNECKTKKARCDSKAPCLRCTKKGLHCRFDLGKDRRRIRGNSNERIFQYQRLFNILRSTTSAGAIRILHHLRSSPLEFQRVSESGDDQALEEVLQLAEELQYSARIPSNLTKFTDIDENNPDKQHQSLRGISDVDPQLSDQSSGLMAQSTCRGDEDHTSTSISLFSQQSFVDSISVSVDVSTSRPLTDGVSGLTNGTAWSANIKTDWEQATAWLNQDIDKAASLLPSRYQPYRRDPGALDSTSRWPDSVVKGSSLAANGLEAKINEDMLELL